MWHTLAPGPPFAPGVPGNPYTQNLQECKQCKFKLHLHVWHPAQSAEKMRVKLKVQLGMKVDIRG